MPAFSSLQSKAMIKNMFKMTRARLVLDLILASILIGLIGAIASVIWMPGVSYRGPVDTNSSVDKVTEANLRKHVQMLAGEIGQRNSLEALQRAREYIASTLRGYGYKVEEQDFSADGNTFKNLQAETLGSSDPSEIVLVGAHYDSVNGSPGANDNGSGVATVLELARQNYGKTNQRTIRFVLFANEEPPYFSSTDMGSYHYAERCSQRKEDVKGLLVMETLGYYTDKENSQSYPSNFVPGYPTTGNFIAFVGNRDSRSLTEQCVGVFRKECNFPSEGVAAPNWVNGVDWSDQYWFWKRGYPALMITDTAPYRYPHYHSLKDTPDKLNYPCFAKVVTGLSKVLHDVAQKSHEH